MKIFLLYIFIVIIQIVYFYISFEKNKNVKMKMKNSNSNKKDLIDKMGKELNKRVELLKSKKMKYNDWLAYNNTNVIVDIDSNKFNIVVYEDLLNNDNFINRVNVYKQYIGLSWQDIVKATNDQLVFSKYSTDKDLLLNANSISEISKNNQSTILYYWVDPESIIVYKRLGHFLRWTDPVTKISGLIGMTYNVENLNDEFKYINIISKRDLIIVSFTTFCISLIICNIEKNTFNAIFKSYLFLIVSNLSIFYYLNKGEGISSSSTELEKMNNINVNVLSLSFLTGINIFILNSFNNDNRIELYKETSIQFAISLIFLLSTLIRITNYVTTNDVIKLRVSNQFKFDFAILINIFIILNYVIFLLSKRFKFEY